MKSVDTPEILIIRRAMDLDGDAPKGGVWKIAFADFMTAMMAFFLVLWLINVTNEETRAGIASYFNPVKLAEATVDKKGLRDPLETEKDGTPDGEKERSAIESEQDSLKGYSRTRNDTHERQPNFSESALFEDPYAVLAALVSGSDPSKEAAPLGGAFETLGQQGKPGLNGGDAQRDPFDPVYWRMSRTPLPNDGPESGGADHNAVEPGTPTPQLTPAAEQSIAPGDHIASGPAPAGDAQQADPSAPVAPPEASTNTAANPESVAAAQPHNITEPPQTAHAEAAAEPAKQPDPVAEALHREEAAERLEGQIETALASMDPAPGVEVRATAEGLLVSIMDESDFGMFAIGSAEPQPELIRAIDTITKLLADRPGAVVVRGHTDGRPFRSKDYDNWRLSTARAHMAYYMLVRGGLPEKRVERIEGYADHRLKVADNPEAPQNRRIEILIRENAT